MSRGRGGIGANGESGTRMTAELNHPERKSGRACDAKVVAIDADNDCTNVLRTIKFDIFLFLY